MRLLLLVIVGIISTNAASPGQVTVENRTIDWGYIKFEWQQVENATKYKVEYKNSTSSVRNDTVLPPNHSWEYDNVPTNENITVIIIASNEEGDGSPTVEEFISRIPKPPVNLTLSLNPEDTLTQIIIRWSHHAELNSFRRFNTIRYKVSYSDHPDFNYKFNITSALITNYTLTGLEENTKYWVQVSVYDTASGDEGKPAKKELFTESDKIENWIIAVVVIVATALIIIALVLATIWHFRSKYPHKKL
ncbi:uncharacterized protein LOC130636510 [Hydractinia symbiolongicarpus]|uniref:uncharacterized protein LOC130636510 n=1 Tax=Hydractinia symbiolongicarpus TaxID=13093 RepID=UPI00254E1235|nr:uncharacterized protein LOC130636510 [Hydractinia symbiolongicarpus]